jgi:hypothetical protein
MRRISALRSRRPPASEALVKGRSEKEGPERQLAAAHAQAVFPINAMRLVNAGSEAKNPCRLDRLRRINRRHSHR